MRDEMNLTFLKKIMADNVVRKILQPRVFTHKNNIIQCLVNHSLINYSLQNDAKYINQM